MAIEKAGYTGKIEIGMDVAASEFCKDKKYDLDFKNPKSDPAAWVRTTLLIHIRYLTDFNYRHLICSVLLIFRTDM